MTPSGTGVNKHFIQIKCFKNKMFNFLNGVFKDYTYYIQLVYKLNVLGTQKYWYKAFFHRNWWLGKIS